MFLFRFLGTTFEGAGCFALAIEEINRDASLLPNLTLGVSLWDSRVNLHSGYKDCTPNYRCWGSPPLAAVVGTTSSALSSPMARHLGLYKIPQVSSPETPIIMLNYIPITSIMGLLIYTKSNSF